MQPSDRIQVLIAHEDALMRAGLTTIFREQPGFSAKVLDTPLVSPESAIDIGRMGTFDVILADYQRSLELLLEFQKLTCISGITSPKVLVVTALSREWEVRFALNAGVFGYVLQGCSVDQILLAVRHLSQGRHYLCQAVTERIAESLTRTSLTLRETEVLEQLTKGSCNKTIARALGVAPGTVKAHVRRIFEKLDSTTRTQAVAVAAHRGLISDEVKQALPHRSRLTQHVHEPIGDFNRHPASMSARLSAEAMAKLTNPPRINQTSMV